MNKKLDLTQPAQQGNNLPRASYIAPGSVMEGTLKAVGDVEIAGNFKGDITTEGTVILHSNIKGNLSVSSLNLSGCDLVGDVNAKGLVAVSSDSSIWGNVNADELQCAGKITGRLTVAGNTKLHDTANIDGDIYCSTMSMVRGATVKGKLDISPKKDS